MGFEIVNGQNQGYPWIRELLWRGRPFFLPPRPVSVPIISPRYRYGYPSIRLLPDLERISLGSPYPEYIMRSFGENVNNGYPCIGSLAGAVRKSFSYLRFGEKPVTALYYNKKSLNSAFCSGKQVFGVYYIAEK